MQDTLLGLSSQHRALSHQKGGSEDRLPEPLLQKPEVLPQGWKHKYIHSLIIILCVGFTSDHDDSISYPELRALLLHRFEQLAITYQEQFAIGVLFVVLCEQLHQELMILGNCEPPDVSQNKVSSAIPRS